MAKEKEKSDKPKQAEAQLPKAPAVKAPTAADVKRLDDTLWSDDGLPWGWIVLSAASAFASADRARSSTWRSPSTTRRAS